MILPRIVDQGDLRVVTNPTHLGIEQTIWSDIPYGHPVSSVSSIGLSQPTQPWPTIFLHLGVDGIEVLGIHASNSEVLEEDATEVVNYRISDFAMQLEPRRSCHGAGVKSPAPELSTRTYKMNDVKVLTDQPLVLLLAVSLTWNRVVRAASSTGVFFNRTVHQAEYEKITLWFPSLMLLEEYPEVSDSWEFVRC
jgi:hypothetical protein